MADNAAVRLTAIQPEPYPYAELHTANVYVNALGDESREKEVMDGLQSASGFLRGQVAQRLDLRSAPILHFRWDPRLRYAEEINDLLDNLNIQPMESKPEASPATEPADE